MAPDIVIDFEVPTESSARGDIIHRIRNFGEDLYRELKRSGLAEIDLAEVDRAIDQIRARTIKVRKVRTVSAFIARMLEQHNLAEIALLSQVKADGQPGDG
jgi:hypothetical protein